MAALLYSSPSLVLTRRFARSPLFASSSTNKKIIATPRISRTRASCQGFFDPFEDQPILKDALKEPVAFMGGVFAGLLRLDLNEDPLKEWISKTVEASGMSPAELAVTAESRGREERKMERPSRLRSNDQVSRHLEELHNLTFPSATLFSSTECSYLPHM